jgi:hypothetical protein
MSLYLSEIYMRFTSGLLLLLKLKLMGLDLKTRQGQQNIKISV